MREPDLRAKAARYGVRLASLRAEEPKSFYLHAMPWNAIEMKHARMRGKAGEDCGRRIGGCPIEDLSQHIPIRFFTKIRVARFGSGDDDSVEPFAPELVDRKVILVDVALSFFIARHIRKGE